MVIIAHNRLSPLKRADPFAWWVSCREDRSEILPTTT